MKKLSLLLFLLAFIGLSSCVSIVYPRKQKVTINTDNKESHVYVDNIEVGKGKTVVARVKKKGAKQVVVQTPNSKDNYYVLLPVKRAIGFYPLYLCNIVNLYGFLLDPMVKYGMSFEKLNAMPAALKFPSKAAGDKYINLLGVKVDVKNTEKDFVNFDIYYSKDIQKKFDKAEKNKMEKDIKKEKKEAKKNNGVKKLDDESKKIKNDESQFSESIYKTLKKTGYVDTVNQIFKDNNNTLSIEGVIKKVNTYTVSGKQYSRYFKSKVFMNWYFRNTYGELLDSTKTEDYSGDFCVAYEDVYNTEAYKEKFYKMYADAVDNSFLNLQKNNTFKKYIRIDNSTIAKTNPLLSIKKPVSYVKELSDATYASVIIKRKDGGHGSGFAITNDGYILTNFHVVSGKKFDKIEDVKVILSNGEELSAKVVRFNREKDIALVKIEKTFDKAFLLLKEKSYKNLLEVYTIGAPKSIELGQTVSIGLISNERKVNNNDLLQLSMSVNSGNSGGPLFEKSGALHGVIASKLVGIGTEGISFAIPSYLIFDFLNISYL